MKLLFKVCNSIFLFLPLFFLNRYLHLNVEFIGEGNNSPWLLLVAISLFFVQALLSFFISKCIGIKSSTMFLMLFFWYLIYRVSIDTGDFLRLKALTVATSGGVILFYLLGFACSLTRNKLTATIQQSTIGYYCFSFQTTLLMALSNLQLLHIFIAFTPQLRSDRFLIAGLEASYQRPGNFLIINSLMLTTVISILLFRNTNDQFTILQKITSFINSFLFMSYTVLAMVIAQMFGSNNAFVSIFCLSMATVIIMFINLFPKKFPALSTKRLSFKALPLGVSAKNLILSVLLSLFIFVLTVFLCIQFFGINFASLRIMGFGRGGPPSSLLSRINIIKTELIPQLAYSPFFGNFEVHEIAGTGSYVHSFTLSIITHLGAIGFSAFLLFLTFAFNSFMKSNRSIGKLCMIYKQNLNKIYTLFLFVSIFSIANLATFLHWAPLWFSIGLFIMLPDDETKN